MTITPAQSRAGRRLLGWSAEELAHRAGVSRNSIGHYERGKRSPRPETLAAIIGALEAAGVVFTPDQPGVKLRKENAP